MSTTCQICGRAIKVATGLIAHHGYQRPHHGYQTRSCIGAREKPYEISCDAIPPAIRHIERWKIQTEALLEDFIRHPPAQLTVTSNGGHTLHHIDRPDMFDVDKPDYRRLSYVSAYRARRHHYEQEIKGSEDQLAYLRQRLAEWKDPNATDQRRSP